MKDQKPANDEVQGEGDYRSARRYKKDIDSFIAKKGKDIPGMAKKAEHDLESGEGPELEKAEEKGKANARH